MNPTPDLASLFPTFRSIPAENETGNRSPKHARKSFTRFIARTCKGRPERYISFCSAGKKSR